MVQTNNIFHGVMEAIDETVIEFDTEIITTEVLLLGSLRSGVLNDYFKKGGVERMCRKLEKFIEQNNQFLLSNNPDMDGPIMSPLILDNINFIKSEIDLLTFLRQPDQFDDLQATKDFYFCPALIDSEIKANVKKEILKSDLFKKIQQEKITDGKVNVTRGKIEFLKPNEENLIGRKNEFNLVLGYCNSGTKNPLYLTHKFGSDVMSLINDIAKVKDVLIVDPWISQDRTSMSAFNKFLRGVDLRN